MTVATETLALLQRLAARTALPRVRALHLPPADAPAQDDGPRGEFCAIELDDGTLGQGYLLLDDHRAALTATPGHWAPPGTPALELACAWATADGAARVVGLAAVNALTRWACDRAGLQPPTSGNSFGDLAPAAGETVGMVGHFTPLIPRLRARGARVVVLELRADLVGEHDGVTVTLDPAALADCRHVLATGTLLLNDTLEAVLGHCRGAVSFTLIGPSVGTPPDPLFARGVTRLGGSWISDRAAWLDALQRGASTREASRKIAWAPDDWPGWEALLARL